MGFIKKVPLPLSGVALAWAALGNLLAGYSVSLKHLCGILSFIGMLLVTCKYLPDLDILKKDLKNPVLASVSGTYSMSLMLLAGYVKPVLFGVADVIWYAAIVMHFILIIYFTLNFILKFKISDDNDLMKVFASYFIVYAGIVVVSVTAPAFNNIFLGKICFWIGFISYIPLFFYVSLRYIKLGNKKIDAKGLGCIYAAPASLCVAGYINSFAEKNIMFLSGLYIFSFAIYLLGIVIACDMCISILKSGQFKFYPSYAGLTFPFVITAIAGKQFNAVLNKAEIQSALTGILPSIVNIEIIIAIAGVVFAAIYFAKAVFFETSLEKATAN